MPRLYGVAGTNRVKSVRLVFIPAPQLKERLSKTRLEIVS
jgi:hypothetical protein